VLRPPLVLPSNLITTLTLSIIMRSVFALAGLAAVVAAAPAAESSSCPVTTTETYTYDGKKTAYTTITEYPDSPGPTETVTLTERVTTKTNTNYITLGGPYVTTCAEPETVTVSIEHTATSYTGDYSSSSLRPSTSCAPTRAVVDVYPEGTTTVPYTVTSSAPQVTVSTTVEVEGNVYLQTVGTITSTLDQISCTSTVTSTTATASSTVIHALKCAPTNLIGTDGQPGQRYRGAVNDGIASYGSGSTISSDEDGAGANKDASSCCQACQDDENCAASLFAGTDSTYPAPSLPYCQLWTNNKETSGSSCGLGFTIFPGGQQIASTGCGYIAENVYWEGECPEGMSPRDCQVAGYVGALAN